MGYDLAMRVWRGDAEGGELRDFTVEVEEGMVVLDAVHRLQATQANDLAVRWNCKAGKCGSCSAEVNGKPRLMCMTRLNLFAPSETITITPLRTFPVVRDLVTDVAFNYEKAEEVPTFAPGRPTGEDGHHRMQQVDVDRVQEFRKCIECFMCQNVCHVIRDHEDKKRVFAGPRLMIRYAELEMHPLDTNDRRDLLRAEAGIGYCNITKCCTDVCPEHIKITDNGIIPLKERVADASFDPIAALGRRLRPSRAGRSAPRTSQITTSQITTSQIGSADPAGTPSADPAGTPSADPAGTPSADPAGTPSVDPAGTPAGPGLVEP